MVIWLCYFSLDLRKANRDWFANVCKHCVMTPSSKTFVKENFKNFHEFSRYIGSTSLRPWLNSFLDIEKTWRNWNFQCNRRHVRRSSGWVLLREMQRSLLFGQCQVRLWWLSGFFIFLELSWVSICFHMFPWFISIFFMVPDQNLPFSIGHGGRTPIFTPRFWTQCLRENHICTKSPPTIIGWAIRPIRSSVFQPSRSPPSLVCTAILHWIHT